MQKVQHIFFLLMILNCIQLTAQKKMETIIPGAERLNLYLPIIEGKQVGIVANNASRIEKIHLVDTLLAYGINVVRIFSPEHGFRGESDAGAHIDNEIDVKTGIEIVSLYGDNKAPLKEQLQGLDIMLFDLQDVGVRFYTYISTLTYVMKACAENNVDVVVLDRPNPNGHYVDGPVLENRFSSFVGLHNVPIVYGMTIGEYGLMVKGEGWNGTSKCQLRIIPILNYDHTSYYELKYKPSPNLPNIRSIYLYPSLCLFEGTVVSIGRGTDFPFQIIGHPDYIKGKFHFVPEVKIGASSDPKLLGRTCSGIDLSQKDISELRENAQLDFNYLIDFYKNLPDKKSFFNNYFNLLAGNSTLQQQITEGLSEDEIRVSWAYDLEIFKKIREKYLLYKDFETRIDLK